MTPAVPQIFDQHLTRKRLTGSKLREDLQAAVRRDEGGQAVGHAAVGWAKGSHVDSDATVGGGDAVVHVAAGGGRAVGHTATEGRVAHVTFDLALRREVLPLCLLTVVAWEAVVA